MEPLEITENQILHKIDNLDPSKSQGPDNISITFIKKTAESIVKPLLHIYKTSLDTSSVPDLWKTASICAVFKKGDKKLLNNYRPISLTCIFVKILESIIRDHITHFLDQNEIITKEQFGFVRNKNTTIQLLCSLKDWTDGIEENCATDCIYFDFKKAFDTVPHKRLKVKIDAFSFHNKISNWLKDFVTNRKQFVKIRNSNSTTLEVTSGIPQGSVLGPILFILYINDITEHINSKIVLFADDIKLYKTIQNNKNDTKQLQDDINKLYRWSEIWLLKFNTTKCNKITYEKKASLQQHTTYHIAQNQLENISEIKDLGVLFEENLNPSTHIYSKVKKASQILGIVRRNFCNLQADIVVNLYKTLIRSQFDYAHCVWQPYKQKDIQKIENIQMRATKMIKDLKNLSYTERLKKLKLPTMRYRSIRGCLIEVYKICNGYYTEEVRNKLSKFRPPSSLRGHKFTLLHERHTTKQRKNFFYHKNINIWNNLPLSVISQENVHLFKNALDKIFLKQDIYYNFRAIVNLPANARY